MKTRIRITLLIVAAMTMTFLFSCSLSPISIEDRIKDFFDSLNGDRSDAYKNLDPSTAAYSLAKPAIFWDTPFPEADEPYSYTSPNTSTESDVTMTISGNGGPLGTYHFVMVDIGSPSENWVINDIRLDPGAPADSIF